ncbi:hypothetical protein [uncultured Enterovirga sp.]|uniref:hypothetical protein n=1 Tax=uncultured Enterovirga sp. TaxID=2026352 RepID=UPI0035CC9062
MTLTKLTAALVLLASAPGLAGCSGGNPVRDLAVASGVTGHEPKPAPDFVTRTRQEGIDYVPVGTSAPKRSYRPKSKTEISEAEAELDGLRARNEARGSGARRKPAE